MFCQYSYATCFDYSFGHHQALNEHCGLIKHIGYSMDPYLLTDYWAANMSREYITKFIENCIVQNDHCEDFKTNMGIYEGCYSILRISLERERIYSIVLLCLIKFHLHYGLSLIHI
jgi:hypothetical protein